MRQGRIFTTMLAVSAAVALAPGSGVAAKPAKVTRLACSLTLNAQGQPNPSGIHLGFAACPAPLGRGLHYNTYTVTPTSPGHGTIASRFKNYYDRGTTKGTAALTFAATSPTNITYTGTVTFTGGTGAFRRIKGKGTIQCTTTDGGAHKACTVNSKVTGI
jgi:hypothetical protein